MTTKILLPGGLREIDAVRYVAFRYRTTPEHVLYRYLEQTGVIDSDGRNDWFELTSNEIALLHDLGVHPTEIEFN